jgi:hypothetical protein
VVEIATGSISRGERHLSNEQQAELRARVDAEAAAFRRGEGDAEALSRLDRGGRAIGDWRAAMRGLLDHQGSYRETPLTRGNQDRGAERVLAALTGSRCRSGSPREPPALRAAGSA